MKVSGAPHFEQLSIEGGLTVSEIELEGLIVYISKKCRNPKNFHEKDREGFVRHFDVTK